MKPKSIFVSIALVAAVLFLLSITAVSRVLSASPNELLQGVKTQPIAAKFLPKRSTLVASLLVNPDRLSLFGELAAKPGDRASLKSELLAWKQQIKQVWALDYDKNIKPWLGDEITLAVTTTDLDRIAENGLQPGYLLALAVKKSGVAKQSLDNFWQSLAISGSDLAFEQYQGVAILSASATATSPALAGATLGKFVLFANDPKVIRNAVNDLQVPDLALANLDTYQNSMRSLTSGRIGSAFVNLGELAGTNAGAKRPEAGLAVGLALDKSGIKAETILTTDTQTSTSTTVSNQDENNLAISYISDGSTLLTGRDLNQTWQQFTNFLQSYPDLNAVVKQSIESLETNSGFKLEDAVAWVKGDYAIGLLPNPVTSQDASPNWVFVGQNTDAKVVNEAMAHLDNDARVNGNLTVGEIPIDDRKLTVWTRLSAVTSKTKNSANSPNTVTVTGTIATVHSQTPEYVFLASSIEAIESALSIDRTPITKSPTFKSITSTLPRNHQGYAYINNTANLSWLGQKFPAIKWSIEPLLPHVKALNIASVGKDKGDAPIIQRGQIFVALQ